MENRNKILKIRNAPVLREVTKHHTRKHARDIRDLDKLVKESVWNHQLNYFNPLMP